MKTRKADAGSQISNPKSQIPSFVPASPPADRLIPVFSVCFGIFLGLSLLKFCNPPIFEKWVESPKDEAEFIFGYPWPISWAYLLLIPLSIFGMIVARWRKTSGRWLIWVLLAWWLWQVVSTTQSVDDNLSTATLKHFTACVVCFGLGFFSLSRTRNLWLFWAGIFSGLLLVILAGWEQHFGGLKSSRDYFFTYIYPNLKEVPPEYLKKMSSERIFATFFYPNALAGGMLLLLPPTLALLWGTERFTKAARWFLIGSIAIGSLACLFWSGSKGGWLLMLVLGVIALLRLPMPAKFRAAIIGLVMLVGIAGFTAKYLEFFRRGATSVSARFDYWEAAIKIARNHATFGTGPGTFFIPYQKIKRPESEVARLAHNDYLQQASDSGFPGMICYCTFIVGALFISSRRSDFRTGWATFALWLGVLGWSLQSMVEFSLYIPSLAWPAFAFLGWLTSGVEPGSSNRRDRADGSAAPA